MSKQKSHHAAVAAMIRKELKKHGIKARARSSSFSMGNSVTVKVENLSPWVRKEVERFCGQFEYGHFDGMFDIYEYSNRRDDIPQVKYVTVDCEYSYEMHQAAYDYLRANWTAYENHPERYEDASNLRGAGDWVSTEVWQVLSGSWDSRTVGSSLKFWQKPRVRVAA